MATSLCWLRQVHGSSVRIVGGTDGSRGSAGIRAPSGGEGDGLVSMSPQVRLVALSADCATVAMGSDEGVFAAVHAGWRGLLAGVIEAAADAMRRLGATTVWGALGPTIHAECYPFSECDLSLMAARYGDVIRSVSSDGRPALDLPGAVGAAFGQAEILQVDGIGACTSCSVEYFSHRGDGDSGRQGLVVWSVAQEEH
ncbi:MAG: laccase domain-containing protein [Acidimicrobiales bacterium]